MVRNLKNKVTYMIASSVIISILVFFSIISVIVVSINRNDSIDFWKDVGMQTSLWLLVTLLTIFLVFSIVNGCIILIKDWENSHLNSIKGVWGLMTFFPLFLIGSAIFGFIAKKNLKNYVGPEKQTKIIKHVSFQCDDVKSKLENC